jgi:hypothetical protein
VLVLVRPSRWAEVGRNWPSHCTTRRGMGGVRPHGTGQTIVRGDPRVALEAVPSDYIITTDSGTGIDRRAGRGPGLLIPGPAEKPRRSRAVRPQERGLAD